MIRILPTHAFVLVRTRTIDRRGLMNIFSSIVADASHSDERHMLSIDSQTQHVDHRSSFAPSRKICRCKQEQRASSSRPSFSPTLSLSRRTYSTRLASNQTRSSIGSIEMILLHSMMRSELVLLLLYLWPIADVQTHALNHSSTPSFKLSDDPRTLAHVKIYSNLAEIIQPLGPLPLEFTAEDWSNIRPDSITLVGADVNVTAQTITMKRKSLNNADVYIRSPSSSNTHTKFIRGTIVDENRNLVKLIDKEISPNPIYISVPADQFLHGSEPPSSNYHLNFTYVATEPVYLSYLRSNLNWKTRYQLNLFDQSKPSMLIAMADIRNGTNCVRWR